MTTMASHDLPTAAKTALEAPSDRSLRVPCYCEENIWRLAYRKVHEQSTSSTTTSTTSPARSRSPSTSYHVAFVSNPAGCVPMFQQLAAAGGFDDPSNPSKPVFWDYHVLLISVTNDVARENRDGHDGDGGRRTTRAGSASVWDVDSLLPCPCPIDDYLKAVFPNYDEWPNKYAPFFRYDFHCVKRMIGTIRKVGRSQAHTSSLFSWHSMQINVQGGGCIPLPATLFQ